MSREKKSGLWRPLLLAGLVVAMLALTSALGLGARLGELRDWIKSLGPWGPMAYGLIYVVAIVAAVPASAMTVLAGVMFGSVAGVALVIVSATVGASLAFLIARYFAREAVSRWLSKSERMDRLDRLTEEHGAVIVALTRLVPVFPFSLLNYGFGLTRVPFRTYVFWSWLCMMPGTVLYVVGADTVTKAITQGRVPWALVGVFAATGIVVAVLVRYARRKLKGGD